MSVYDYTSYKAFLKDQIEKKKRVGLMTDLAAAAGCDRTYLSQVLSGKAQLTPDHAVNLAEAFSLDPDESDYFLLLVLRERSSNAKASKRISLKLDHLRKANAVLSKKIRQFEEPQELASQSQLVYYRNWKFAAVHISLSLPHVRTSAQVARVLGVPEGEAAEILETLVRMGLAKRQGNQFHHGGGNVHISHESPLVAFNHHNWRMRAIDSASQTGATEGGLHYTDVFSISESDIPALRALVLDFIEKLRKKIRASGSEEAYAFCCDLFQVSRKSRS